jgi:hypothetical protein
LTPDAADRVDLQVVINLCTGMTSWLVDPTEAIAEVAHGVGIVAETMTWARTGWMQLLTDFSLDGRTRPRTGGEQKDPGPQVPTEIQTTSSQKISLDIPRIRRDPHLPDLALSDALRGRLAWLAVETGRPVDEVLNLLIDLYLKWQHQPETVATLWKVLQLAHSLNRADVDIEDLHGYLAAEAALRKHQCRFEDVPEALRVIEHLTVGCPRVGKWKERNNCADVVILKGERTAVGDEH